MAIPAEFNSRIDKNVDYVFDWQFTEDNETPIPVDTWSFEFLLKDPLGTTIWDVINADFGRPSTGRITFTKTIAEIAALSGLYSIQLLVTKAATLNDIYVYGLYEFVDE